VDAELALFLGAQIRKSGQAVIIMPPDSSLGKAFT
jgi:hypothetical protein